MMHRADIALDRRQHNLFGVIAAGNMDCTDSVGKLVVLGVAEGQPGQVVKQLGFSVEDWSSGSGIHAVQKYRVHILNHEPITLEVDAQRGALKNTAGESHANVILTIGVESQNLNRRPV